MALSIRRTGATGAAIGSILSSETGRAITRSAARQAGQQLYSLYQRGSDALQRMRTRSGRSYRAGQSAARRSRFRQARTVRSKRTTGGRGVTQEHDRQFIYRKKSMPYGKKRRWKQFKRKIQAVSEKELGSRTVLFNKLHTAENTTNGNQLVTTFGLYTNKSTDSLNNDLNAISTLENQGDSTAAAGETVDLTSKIMFQSAVLDITMRNTSHSNDTPTTIDTDATLEVDIYEMKVNRRQLASYLGGPPTTLQPYTTLLNGFLSQDPKDKTIGGAGTGIKINLRGATPWDVPFALSAMKVKILKKTKMFINPGKTATYQYRDPKRRVTSLERMENGAGCNFGKWTHHIMIIAKAIPGLTVGSVTDTLNEELSIGVTRKYFYKVEGMNDTRDRWLNA